MAQLTLPSPYGKFEFEWQKVYGLVYRIRGCFGEDRLMVFDPVALQYLINSPTFARGPVLDGLLSVIFTRKSILTAKGDEHRRLRSALNVGFTVAAVRDYQSIFENVAESVSFAKETKWCPDFG
ncbi:hypothetical protein C8R47DRAFT_1101439 [Mycena vitilis]|nr:hypothetical protein C8R47DRAFT_1101439 [Mycena vitilis]